VIAAVVSGLSDATVMTVPAATAPLSILSVGLVNHDRSVVVGEKANFIGYSNYPGAIARGELRIFDAAVPLDGAPHFVKPFDKNGSASWMPTNYAANDMRYVYRVYDRNGNFDETAPQLLKVLPAGAMAVSGAVSRPEFGTMDSASIRGISTANLKPLPGDRENLVSRAQS